MQNYTPNELAALANQLSWEEVVPAESSEVLKRYMAKDGYQHVLEWRISTDSESIEGITVGEGGKMMVADIAAGGFKELSKFEALKQFRFGGDYNRTAKYIAQRVNAQVSTLAQVSRSLQTSRLQEILEMSIDERNECSAEWNESVAADRFAYESKEEAKRQHRQALLGQDGPPEAPISMADFLHQELEETLFLISELAPWGSTVLVFAQAKTGKTTLGFNLMRSIADEEPFLGYFEVAHTQGNIGFLNFELTESMCQQWAKKIPVSNTERIHIWNLRGKNNPFRSLESMKEFAREVFPLRIECMILDPFSGAFIGDTNNNDEVKRFLLMLEEFKVLSGVTHLFIMAHAGNDASKPRGATTLRDHPDAIWSLYKDNDDIRYFKAEGRDVALDKGFLEFESSTGLLTFRTALSSEKSGFNLKSRIYEYIAQNPNCIATDIDKNISGSKAKKSHFRQELVNEGLVQIEVGPRNAKFYKAVSESVVPESFSGDGRLRVSSRSPLFIRGTTVGETDSIEVLTCTRCGKSPISENDINLYRGEGTLCPHCGARDWQLLRAAANLS